MGDDSKAPSGALLPGVLDLCLLALLVARRDYGYGLTQRLALAGIPDVPGGTLYPALLRLERAGLVAVTREPSESGPPRKYYSVTAAGRTEYEDRARRWHALRDAVDGLLDGAPVTSDDEKVSR